MMKKGFTQITAGLGRFQKAAQEKLQRFLWEEKGDLVSSLGWMAIMALALVIIKGLVDGKLVGYVNTVFVHLDRLFNA